MILTPFSQAQLVVNKGTVPISGIRHVSRSIFLLNPFGANVPIWEHSVFSMVKGQVESN